MTVGKLRRIPFTGKMWAIRWARSGTWEDVGADGYRIESFLQVACVYKRGGDDCLYRVVVGPVAINIGLFKQGKRHKSHSADKPA